MRKIIISFWKFFKSTHLGKLVRFLAPQWMVNLLEHLPLAILANIIYGFPSGKIRVIGVTGTDGKTTTTNMIYQILKEAGLNVSMVSTINAVIGNKIYDTGFHVTSPHPFAIQEFIKQAVEAGSKYIILETTSHALDQYRFWGIRFDIGIITNVTHEHLDYHKTMENYLHTKMKLVDSAGKGVVNENLRSFFEGTKKVKLVTFGLVNGDFNQQKIRLKLKILGNYNIENALAAIAAASLLGIDQKITEKALCSFKNLPGRMEEIQNKRGVRAVIDFAHTPHALESALKALRQETKGRLISVFGAASERDRTKRPLMGRISARLADITILTDEDPRFEDGDKIIEEIAQGAYLEKVVDGKNFFKQPDRYQAIRLALSLAKRGDTVGIFGKGHEKSMNYKGVEKKWSDKAAVLRILNQESYER